MQMDNSVIDRCYNHEANYFYDRLERINKAPKYKDLFIQQSKKYLIDETPATALSNVFANDIKHKTVSLYYGGKIPNHFTVYNGKEARKNSIISDLTKVGNPLYIVANFYHVIIDNKK